MIEVIQSATFSRWITGLKDRQAVQRINARIRRLSLGIPGDFKTLRNGIAELRIDYGPGYRIYFIRRGATFVVLLTGGDKSTQGADIDRAITIAKGYLE